MDTNANQESRRRTFQFGDERMHTGQSSSLGLHGQSGREEVGLREEPIPLPCRHEPGFTTGRFAFQTRGCRLANVAARAYCALVVTEAVSGVHA